MNFFQKQCDKMKIELNKTQFEQFELYYEFLVDYNKKINLTSITNKDEVYIKHFLDSISVSKFLDLKGKLIDIGTGAGFPGVPLKILNPNLDVTLLESSKKKTIFLEKLSNALGLKYEIINSRAEESSKLELYREKFDICISRAVASLDILTELCIPFLKVRGTFLAMKGPSLDDEIAKSKSAILNLNCKIKDIFKFELPMNFGKRNIVLIEKISKTPKKYPRSFSEIKSKKP